jgi:hypothetical protein
VTIDQRRFHPSGMYCRARGAINAAMPFFTAFR